MDGTLLYPRPPETVTWNLWHGCQKVSYGCQHCYTFRRDESVGKDPTKMVRTQAFYLPVTRLCAGTHKGLYKVPSGSHIFHLLLFRCDKLWTLSNLRQARNLQVIQPIHYPSINEFARNCACLHYRISVYKRPEQRFPQNRNHGFHSSGFSVSITPDSGGIPGRYIQYLYNHSANNTLQASFHLVSIIKTQSLTI